MGEEIMIEYLDGTVFNAPVQSRVNTVNTVGFMGAGLALEFALRYPKLLEDYEKKCEQRKMNVGKVDYFDIDDKTKIINFPTKGHFKYPSRISWIEAGLKNFLETYEENGVDSVAFPRLGCANGGLNWVEVKPLMEKYLGSLDIPVYICLDKLPYAEGVEKEMVDKFNKTDIDIFAKACGLTKKQCELLTDSKPLQRFWHISKKSGIGVKTYNRLFNYFYNFQDSYTQLTLFD